MAQFDIVLILKLRSSSVIRWACLSFGAEKGDPVIATPSVLRPTLVSRKMLFVKGHIRIVVKVTSVDHHGDEAKGFALHRWSTSFLPISSEKRALTFHFVLHLVKNPTKDKAKHWKRWYWVFLLDFSPLDICTCFLGEEDYWPVLAAQTKVTFLAACPQFPAWRLQSRRRLRAVGFLYQARNVTL